MSDAAALFAAHAATYDAARRALIPPFDRFYGAAIDALELAGEPMGRVLDLGAGTGPPRGRVAAGPVRGGGERRRGAGRGADGPGPGPRCGHGPAQRHGRRGPSERGAR